MISSIRRYVSDRFSAQRREEPRSLKICIVDPFPGEIFSWERQFIGHLSAALTQCGHSASTVRCSDEILRQDPDAVIVVNEAVAKLTHHYTIGFVWTYLAEDRTDAEKERAIRSWDLVVPSSLKTRRFVRDLLFPNRMAHGLTEADYHATVLPTELEAADPTRLRLIRVGRFSGLRRERRILEELGKSVGLSVYGPEKDWEFLDPGIYRGRLPTEPHAVTALMNRHGAALVLHGLIEDADENPSLHFFEACAAKCLIFTDPNEAVSRPFGDSLCYIDLGQDAAQIAAGVRDTLTGLSSDPESFRRRCAASASIHRERFSLEALISELVQHIDRNGVEAGARRKGRGDGPSVSVILRCGDRPLSMVDRAVASLRAQDYARIGLIVVTYAHRPDLEKWLGRLERDARFLFVRHLRCQASGVRSATLWAGFRAVETELFCNLDDDDELFPNHIGDLVSLLDAHADVDFVYSGSIRQEEDGLFFNKNARFKGDLGIEVPERRGIDRFEDYDVSKLLAFKCIMASNAWMARRSVLAPDLLEDPDLEVAEDMYFFVLVANRHRMMFSGTASALYNFRSVAKDNTVDAVPRSVWDDCMQRLVKRVERLAFPITRSGLAAINFAGEDVTPRDADLDGGFDYDDLKLDFAKPGLPSGVKRWTGISGPEAWGRWTDGAEAEIVFRRPLPPRFALEVHGAAFGENGRSAITVVIGKRATPLLMAGTGPAETYSLDVDNQEERNSLRFAIPHPTKPSEVAGSHSDDKRGLGVAISWIRIRARA